jgi:type I restriction enzyme M protein
MVSTAPTCGLTKGGRLLPIIDRETGNRLQTIDPETNEYIDAIDDKLLEDAKALSSAKKSPTLRFVPKKDVSLRCAVPVYYDRRYHDAFHAAMKEKAFKGFSSSTIGQLVQDNIITVRGGHGSPSQDQRIGEVPYIKVSDLRAGLVNINPTNRVPLSVARKFWKGDSSGLRAFDLISPERTSKNIGDFCILLPGQEQVVTTKEVIILRPGSAANFDAFYLLWAFSLKIVRDQWRRIVFMQTNREDVGKRYLEIEIPIPPMAERAAYVSASFREYYQSIATARLKLIDYLNANPVHHFFVSGAESIDGEPGEIDLPGNGDIAE